MEHDLASGFDRVGQVVRAGRVLAVVGFAGRRHRHGGRVGRFHDAFQSGRAGSARLAVAVRVVAGDHDLFAHDERVAVSRCDHAGRQAGVGRLACDGGSIDRTVGPVDAVACPAVGELSVAVPAPGPQVAVVGDGVVGVVARGDGFDVLQSGDEAAADLDGAVRTEAEHRVRSGRDLCEDASDRVRVRLEAYSVPDGAVRCQRGPGARGGADLGERRSRLDPRPVGRRSPSRVPEGSVRGDGDGELVAARHVGERLVRRGLGPCGPVVGVAQAELAAAVPSCHVQVSVAADGGGVFASGRDLAPRAVHDGGLVGVGRRVPVVRVGREAELAVLVVAPRVQDALVGEDELVAAAGGDLLRSACFDADGARGGGHVMDLGAHPVGEDAGRVEPGVAFVLDLHVPGDGACRVVAGQAGAGLVDGGLRVGFRVAEVDAGLVHADAERDAVGRVLGLFLELVAPAARVLHAHGPAVVRRGPGLHSAAGGGAVLAFHLGDVAA